MGHVHRLLAIIAALAGIGSDTPGLFAAALPAADTIRPVKILEVDHYCEGVVFDADGAGPHFAG